MIGTGTIVLIVFLFLILAIAIWWFVVAYNYGSSLTVASYTRGANLDTASVTAGGQPYSTGKGTVNLTCDPDREICVYRATAICTGAENQNSNNESGVEPISNGLTNNGFYGNFDINNTVDLTDKLSGLANGSQAYSYNFDTTNVNNNTTGPVQPMLFNGQICPWANYGQSGPGPQFVRPQLIATYACIPKGSQCLSANSVIPYTPIVPVPPPTTPVKYGSQITLRCQSTQPGYNKLITPCGFNNGSNCTNNVSLPSKSPIPNISNWNILGKPAGTIVKYGDVIQLKCQTIAGNFNASYLAVSSIAQCGVLGICTMLTNISRDTGWQIIGGTNGQPVKNGDIILLALAAANGQYPTILTACGAISKPCGVNLTVSGPAIPFLESKWQLIVA